MRSTKYQVRSAKEDKVSSFDLRPSSFNRRAFTLMELLIVMLIIAVLAAIALTALQGAAEEARADRTRSIIAKLDQLVMQRYDGNTTALGNSLMRQLLQHETRTNDRQLRASAIGRRRG